MGRLSITFLLDIPISFSAGFWFNLDTKLVKALEKPMMRHYDRLPRDHRL